MGSMSKKSKTSSTSTGTTTATPNAPSWIEGPARNFFGAVNTAMGETPTTIGPNANQTAAFQGAGGLGGMQQSIMEALRGSNGLMNFTPQNVSAGQLRDTDLSPYMNPYTEGVIDTSMRDLERARAGAIAEGQGRATMSGSFGGSRHGVADAETNRGFLDSASSLVANLRDANFRQAQGAAAGDIDRRFQADVGNADRGVTGAGLRLSAVDRGLAADGSMRQDLLTRAGLGAMERDIATENDPQQARIRQLQQIAQLLGINPSQFIGQTINQSGSSSGTQTQGGGFNFGWGPDGLSFGWG